jgi:uncharacterized protein (TIGR00730 family)
MAKAKTKKKGSIKRVCVFCGASPKVPPVFLDMAYDVGKKLAKKKYTLVYGGGNSGLMGASANGVLEAGGEVVGIFPDILKGKEAEHLGLTVLIQTKTMHERKREMYDRSDAFVILPGGLGTMDEFFEIATWRKLGGHNKPIIIYDFMGYWERLLKLLQSMIRHGFMGADTSSIFLVARTEEELFDLLKKN